MINITLLKRLESTDDLISLLKSLGVKKQIDYEKVKLILDKLNSCDTDGDYILLIINIGDVIDTMYNTCCGVLKEANPKHLYCNQCYQCFADSKMHEHCTYCNYVKKPDEVHVHCCSCCELQPEDRVKGHPLYIGFFCSKPDCYR